MDGLPPAGRTTWTARHPRLTFWGLLAVVAVLGVAGYQWWQRAKMRAAYQGVVQTAERREWKAAGESLKDAMPRWPDRPEFHLLAARVERRLAHLDEAKRHLDTCERLEAKETDAVKVERALLRVYTGGLSEVDAFLQERVRQDDPAAVEILDTLSAAYELNYRDAEAQRCLDQLLRRQPDHFDALVRRGRTAQNMQWYEDAAHHFERALRVKPDADNVRLLLAQTLGVFGRFDLAREHFEHLREKQPTDLGVVFGLAMCAAGTGEQGKALALYDRLVAATPDNWMILQERGKLAVQMDRPDIGVNDLLRADTLAPPDTSPIALVDCLLLLGRNDDARKYQQKVDRIQADNTRVAKLGDQIRGGAANDPDPRCELGRALLRLGKQREGVHWLRTALEKDPNHRPSHEALAEFFQSVNAPDQAEPHRRALQKLPSSR